MAKKELGPQASVRFRPDELRRRRVAAQLTQEALAAKADISYDAYRRAERGDPVSLDTARGIGSAIGVDYTTISTPVAADLRTPRFKLSPIPNVGANMKPHPSYVDEEKGYCFAGKFRAESEIDCDVMRIVLLVVRNDHYPICVGPGKASYYNGPLPGETRRFGYVLIDGEERHVDGDDRFLQLLPVVAGQRFIIGIWRWCRAILMSRNEPATLSIEYWIENPTQIVSVEFAHAGRTYAEDHVFAFDQGRMVFVESRIRPL